MPSSKPSDRSKALAIFQKAYEYQMEGEVDVAVRLYRQSIELLPTAEAHTFLGWSLSLQGKLDEAIDECKKAISIDEEFGNPWNDIGAYLVEQGKPWDALPYFQHALISKRYECRHYPHFNIGRVYLKLGMTYSALHQFELALSVSPQYDLARKAIVSVSRLLN